MPSFITMIAAVLLLTGTSCSLLAANEPDSKITFPTEELRMQHERFANDLSQKLNHFVERLEQVERTRLIVQSATFLSLLRQLHPGIPEIIAVQNVPLAAIRSQRLMREWKHSRLRAILESAKQLKLHLNQPPVVIAITNLLENRANPLTRVTGHLFF